MKYEGQAIQTFPLDGGFVELKFDLKTDSVNKFNALTMGELKEVVEKLTKGPVAIMTVMQPGPPSMGKNLVQWFIFCIVVSIITAYITGHAVARGGDYLAVFRFAGCTAFVAYAIAQWQDSIWYRRAWSTTIKNNIDGLIYGLLTAGVFGWLWPSV